jgi:Ca2+-binding RTX toxin-like protein
MPSVTIQGAGSVYPTLTAGTNSAIARQAAAIISAAISNGAGVVTVTSGSTAMTPSTTPSLLVVNTNNQTNLNYPSNYPYVAVGDTFAPSIVLSEGANSMTGQEIILGSGTVQLNTGGGSGTVVGGDGTKSINLGATSGFAVYTGSGHDTIDLSSSLATGRSTVEAGAGITVYNNTGGITQPGNTILLGAGATQVRSTGSDSITAGAGSATIQVVGNVQDTVVGGAGTLNIVNDSVASTVNFSTATNAPLSSGSITALGGAGGGYYRGGSSGSNLLIGSLGAVTLQGAGNGDVLIAMGTSGTQVLYAGSGNETLLGSLSTASNLFVAGPGNDVILGGSGSDTFVAGTGAATITSGAGPDLFMLNANTSAGAQITITDFTPGVDYLRLSNYSGANTPGPLAAAAANLGTAGSRITLSDGTTITFQGLSSVTSGFFG